MIGSGLAHLRQARPDLTFDEEARLTVMKIRRAASAAEQHEALAASSAYQQLPPQIAAYEASLFALSLSENSYDPAKWSEAVVTRLSATTMITEQLFAAGVGQWRASKAREIYPDQLNGLPSLSGWLVAADVDFSLKKKAPASALEQMVSQAAKDCPDLLPRYRALADSLLEPIAPSSSGNYVDALSAAPADRGVIALMQQNAFLAQLEILDVLEMDLS